MLVNNTSNGSSTSSFPMADRGNNLSIFSFNKVYSMVNQSIQKTSVQIGQHPNFRTGQGSSSKYPPTSLPQPMQSTTSQPLRTNTPQQDVSDRPISICTRVKTMLTPSESTARKLKICAVVLSIVAIVAGINGVAIGGLATIIILCKLNIIINVAIGAAMLICSACVSIYLATACFIESYSLRYNSQDNTYISRPKYRPTKQSSDISDSEDSRKNKIHQLCNSRSRYPRPSRNIFNTGYHDTNKSKDNILKIIRNLYTALGTRDMKIPHISTLFELTKEIQNLSFLSGNSSYDNARETLARYLRTNPQLQEPLLQYAIEQDNNTLNKMLDDISICNPLSLEKMDAYYELLEESANTPEDSPNTKDFRSALAHRLIEELSSLDQKIVNASDARRRLTELNEDLITETIDQFNQMGTQNEEPQKTTSNIDDLIEKLHYTHRLFSLLNSCYISSQESKLYPSLWGSKSTLSNEQCAQLTQCDEIYKNLRSQLLHICSNTKNKSPKVWAFSAMVKQLNRTWIERYENQPFPVDHAKSPIPLKNECSIATESFEEIAPTIEQADNIVILDSENCLYDKTSIIQWAKNKSVFNGPISNDVSHIMDIVPLTKILNMKKFTIEGLLPAALPLDFIPKQAEAI